MFKTITLLIIVLMAIVPVQVNAQAPVSPPSASLWRNPNAPIPARVQDLLSQLTPAEKASFLYWIPQPIPRLGIPSITMGDEGLHGIVRPASVNFTMFPENIGMGASFDPALMHSVASAISDEARAETNAANGADLGQKNWPYFLWSPVVNLARDPRWGRTQEGFGEDPWLAGRLGVAFVRGIQGDDPHYLKCVSTPKHFAVYDQEDGRGSNNNIVGERYLMEYDLLPFEACIKEGKAESIMSSYSAINGVPCSASKLLLTDILRNRWGFTGYVVSDCGAVSNTVDLHNYAATPEQAIADCLNAGLDVEGGWFSKYPDVVDNYLPKALSEGFVTQAVVDRSVTRILTARFKLGLFDPPACVPYSKIPASDIDSPEHRALARQMGDETIVLLKNDSYNGGKPLLPIDASTVKNICVIGPYADVAQYGGYSKEGTPTPSVTPFGGLLAMGQKRGIIVTKESFNSGSQISDHDADTIRSADLVVAVMGLNTGIEYEGGDRSTIAMPPDQESYVRSAMAINPRTVIVLEGGSSIASPWLFSNATSLLDAWYPGEEGGDAIADVLFGDYNPSGRLPITFYASDAQLRPMTEYDLTKGRTYMYLADKPAFAFGHGLSYTTFQYGPLKVSRKSVISGGRFYVSLNITNTGSAPGDEVVQCYVHCENQPVVMPIKQLWAFQKVSVPVGKTVRVTLPLDSSRFGYWDTTSESFKVPTGKYDILVGAASDDIRQTGYVVVNGS